jgi:hypothetical protein
MFLNPVKASTLSLTIEFYKNDTAILKDYYFTTENFATFLPYQATGDYSVKIFDKNNSLLFSEKFNVLFLIQIYGDNDIISEEINSTVSNLRLYLPPKSFFIKFYRNEKEILSLTLSDFVCKKNNICEKEMGEDEYLCPSECLILTQKPICGNNICETNLGENSNNCPQDCLTTKLTPKPKTPTYVYIIIILVIFVIIGLFLYKIRIVKVKQANF